jgi:hypothetical protein
VKPFLLALLCLLTLTAAAPAPEASWYVIMADNGARIGHASQVSAQTPTGRETVQEQEVVLQEKGSAVSRVTTRTVTTEDTAGAVRAIVHSSKTGSGLTRHEAVIAPGRAVITRQTASGKHSAAIPLPPTLRFDGGDALLKAWAPGRTPTLEFDSLDVDGMTVDHVVIEAVPPAAGDPPGGYAALRKRYENGQLQSIARLTLNAERRIVAVSQPMFGTTITLKASTREAALAPHPPYQVIGRVMTKSLFRVLPAAKRGHIRYRFGFKDGIQFPMPQTGEQKATPGAGFTVIDLCETCGPGLPTDPAYLADARRPTAWLQSDHRKLRAIAAPVARLKVSDTRKMQMLLAKARPYLGRIDFVGHYSALDALNRRAGDCTEAAVILAALGRAAGIPTKVANGLVYSREKYHGVSNAFLPHSWTLAYVDGEWLSFDLALDDFDATHIAISVGDGDSRSLAAASQLGSLLVWQDMKEVRTRS